MELGYHLCYGDYEHLPPTVPTRPGARPPVDARGVTELASTLCAEISRPVDFIHIPVPRDSGNAYLEPLAGLQLPAATELYLGVVHLTDGLAGAQRRVDPRYSRDTFQVKATGGHGQVVDPALGWSNRLQVEVGGAGTVAQAGVVLPQLLADRLGLTGELAEVMARAGFFPLRHRGRALVDLTCALAAGATCLSDVEAMTAREELFGPGGGVSDSTLLRVLDEFADRLGRDGLPGRRLARAMARARAAAWAAVVARHGQLPAVQVAGRDLARPVSSGPVHPAVTASEAAARPVLVIRLDATLIEAASPKAQAAGHDKGGYGFHPLGSWCTNTGEAMAVMPRPGNAGSFTTADHIAVLDATFGQIPAAWRTDVLVTIDGAGAFREVIDHLTGLNTAAAHGKRGRRVEYSIGWPVDQRTLAGIERLRQTDWGAALDTDGGIDPQAQVADLTGIPRHGSGGDRLAGWPADPRVIARRTPRPATKPAKLGEHPDYEYGAFVTNTVAGQAQFLDARHRTQAHVEDRMKQFKACGARNLPSINYGRNAAWPRLAALATSLTAWLRHIGLDDDLAKASTKTLRFADPVRPGPPGHPRQTPHPHDPTRLGLGPEPGHRLAPPPRPAPGLTHNPQPTQRPAATPPAERVELDAHPSTISHPNTPEPTIHPGKIHTADDQADVDQRE